MNFTEAVASVPDPIVLAGHVLAAVLILSRARAYAAGVGWGMGLWFLGVLLDPDPDRTASIVSAQLFGSLSGNFVGMWVVLTVVGAVRAVRSRRSEARAPKDRGP